MGKAISIMAEAGLLLLLLVGISALDSGCAQIGMPGGGAKDTIAPVLVRSNPENNSVNFEGNKITLSFNEYIEVKDIQANTMLSPLPKRNPVVSSNLRTVTIKLKDTLQPNTTYSFDFGNAIVDLNESNPLKNFTYTFSTGAVIDSLTLSGKVQMAETGKADSTLSVILYRDAVDSSVRSRRPDYVAKLKGDGSFTFKHLPAGTFKVYALKDGDGNRYYNSKTEAFAFIDADVTLPNAAPVSLFAYQQEKEAPSASAPPTTAKGKSAERKLRYNSNQPGLRQDLLQPLELSFNYVLQEIDTQKIILADTNFIAVNDRKLTVDSTRKKITIKSNWQPEAVYVLIIQKDAVADSTGLQLPKTDTVRFSAKSAAEYGRVILRFKNFDGSKHPVLQFLEQDMVKFSYPLTSREWSDKRFPPGEYQIRILIDENNNGKWDPGNYAEKRQPEKAILLPQKLSIKADWDNEREIEW